MASETKGIKIDGYIGRWSVIDKTIRCAKSYFLLESDNCGDDVPAIIVDKHCNVILDEVYNGFSDLDEYIAEKEVELFASIL